ncbi:hypothetical protein BDN70DRAFT_915510 [Pholiota conissans]|uniref:DUF2415 domain-containing protein n=1 Tax=Pholiota conissans TaxID=109636 RepID=A0A9P5YSH4_9AGAR|nr:hypothetical protein BDN70DRAFT_915510 [Pholiota conissans]
MARDPSLLDSNQPSSIAPATPAIAHVQLRDLLICPREQGVLNYIVPRGIVEQDLNKPKAPVRVLSNLSFTPNSLTSLQLGNDTLIAAGGQETEIHLSYHTPSSTSTSSRTRVAWEFEDSLTGSINNSVLLTSLSLTRSNESSVDPRVGISNNDGSVRLYDIPLRVSSPKRKLRQVGQVKLDVPINHSSISPDGRTLLSVGDSNKVYIHQITGGASISFAPITTLTIPPPDASPLPYASSSLAAAFSTAFSGDGTKFAVASQEGVVAVWDVRSTKPMKVFQTDKMRGMGGGGSSGNGSASGWLSDDPFEWTRGTKAPGWCVRSVKFNGGEGARLGKEVMAFTEHTSLVHLVDARTFETHDIIRVPSLQRPEQSANPSRRGPSSTDARRATSSSSRRTSTTAGTGSSITRRSHSPAEVYESALAHQQANSSSSSSRNVIRRLLPVSNARRSGHASSSPGTSTNTRPTRTFAPSQSAAVHLANRAAARAHSRSHSAMEMGSGSSSLTPATRLPSASAARLTAGAGRRSMSASASSSATLSTSGTPVPASRPASTSGTPAIVQALGDAFRIPVPASAYSAPASIGDSTWRTLGSDWRELGLLSRLNAASASASGADPSGTNGEVGPSNASHRREAFDTHMDDGDADEGIVVVPDLGDRDVESEVHALLAVHGIQSRLGGREAPSRHSTESSDNADGVMDPTSQVPHPFDAYMNDEDAIQEDGADIDVDDEEERAENGQTNEEDHQAWFMRALASLHDVGGGADVQSLYAEADGEDDERVEDGYDVRDEDRMRVDEEGEENRENVDARGEGDEDEDLDFECASRGSNSRSGSPLASSGIRGPGPAATSPLAHTSSSPSSSRRYGSHGLSLPPWPSTLSPSSSSSFAKNAATRDLKYVYYEDLDIAGLCFDPWGERMYVSGVGMGGNSGYGMHGVHAHGTAEVRAGMFGYSNSGNAGEGTGVGAVVEWVVRGAEKRWWVDDGWM